MKGQPLAPAPSLAPEERDSVLDDADKILNVDRAAANGTDTAPAAETTESPQGETPIAKPAPAPQPPGASNGHDKSHAQLLVQQIGATLEHADALVKGGYTTTEKVAKASEAELRRHVHPVFAKTLLKAAHRWIAAQRAAGDAR